MTYFGVEKPVFKGETAPSSLEMGCEVSPFAGIEDGFKPSYNIAPTAEILAIINHNGRQITKFRWGLVPSWAADISSASRMINAKAETLAEKPSFKNAFKHQRCLIPADGFYEWQQKHGKKQAWYFTLPSSIVNLKSKTLNQRTPLAFAGLWETWNKGASYNSCTVITMASYGAVKNIHPRMPVILKPQAFYSWLDPNITDAGTLYKILENDYLRTLSCYPVSQEVNSVKNDNPSCIAPVSDIPAGQTLLSDFD